MTRPLAYEPEHGQMFHILTKQVSDRTWEHCDYAKDLCEKKYLTNEYRLAYGSSFEFQSIRIPAKYRKGIK